MHFCLKARSDDGDPPGGGIGERVERKRAFIEAAMILTPMMPASGSIPLSTRSQPPSWRAIDRGGNWPGLHRDE
jgi:hypothetical protein